MTQIRDQVSWILASRILYENSTKNSFVAKFPSKNSFVAFLRLSTSHEKFWIVLNYVLIYELKTRVSWLLLQRGKGNCLVVISNDTSIDRHRRRSKRSCTTPSVSCFVPYQSDTRCQVDMYIRWIILSLLINCKQTCAFNLGNKVFTVLQNCYQQNSPYLSKKVRIAQHI